MFSKIACSEWIFDVVKKEKADILDQNVESNQSCQNTEC